MIFICFASLGSMGQDILYNSRFGIPSRLVIDSSIGDLHVNAGGRFLVTFLGIWWISERYVWLNSNPNGSVFTIVIVCTRTLSDVLFRDIDKATTVGEDVEGCFSMVSSV